MAPSKAAEAARKLPDYVNEVAPQDVIRSL